jgi:L-cystine uptake protein TcyP (sodium:dicarboxylate symporter family)
MPILALLNLVLFAGLLSMLYQLGKREQWTLSRRVLLGLVLGTGFGFLLTAIYGGNQPILDSTLEWTNIVGSSYVSLLRMIIMPLILITMIAAVLKVDEIKTLGKIGGTVVSVLIVTTVIAALIGIGMALLFNLEAISQEALVNSRAQRSSRPAVLRGQTTA